MNLSTNHENWNEVRLDRMDLDTWFCGIRPSVSIATFTRWTPLRIYEMRYRSFNVVTVCELYDEACSGASGCWELATRWQ